MEFLVVVLGRFWGRVNLSCSDIHLISVSFQYLSMYHFCCVRIHGEIFSANPKCLELRRRIWWEHWDCPMAEFVVGNCRRLKSLSGGCVSVRLWFCSSDFVLILFWVCSGFVLVCSSGLFFAWLLDNQNRQSIDCWPDMGFEPRDPMSFLINVFRPWRSAHRSIRSLYKTCRSSTYLIALPRNRSTCTNTVPHLAQLPPILPYLESPDHRDRVLLPPNVHSIICISSANTVNERIRRVTARCNCTRRHVSFVHIARCQDTARKKQSSDADSDMQVFSVLLASFSVLLAFFSAI